MTYEVRALQARCAALGFWPGPIDGKYGSRTKAAEEAARKSQAAKGLPFIHPSGLTRIHLHWTAGGHKANATDRQHYHTVIEGDGTEVKCADPWVRRSHTLNANGGAIGLSMCCMAGAVERPFAWGQAPITPAQLDRLARVAARLSIAYDIPVTQWSVLSHAEVQPTLGITQRGKIDIMCLPGMSQMADPIAVGNKIRALILANMR